MKLIHWLKKDKDYLTYNCMAHLFEKISPCLMTDLYQLTMAYGFWKTNMSERKAIFQMNFRKSPFHGGVTVCAGLQNVIDALENYRFENDDIDYLRTLLDKAGSPLFEEDFLVYLKNLKFSLSIEAIEEGEIVFPHEPLIKVQGPLIQCQLIESLLLNIINFQTLIATKAARLSIAANGAPIYELGFRRAQGVDGAISASRAAYIGGCAATSNVIAGKWFNVPVTGTIAHSWIMAFDYEIDAFEAFAKALPNNTVFLVDTYHTIKGIENAISVGKKMKESGYSFLGIRLDSGDLAYLSIQARKMLDEAGFYDAKVIASNELDELIIRDLIQQGAKICVWGVGTNLVTASGQSALDGVYKMTALKDKDGNWKDKIKLSEQMIKTTNPGSLQVRRFINSTGSYCGDGVYDTFNQVPLDPWGVVDPLDPTKKKHFEKHLNHRDLLIPIFKKGELIYSSPKLSEMQAKVKVELTKFHMGLKRFLFPHQYPVGLEESLYSKKINLIEKIRQDKCTNAPL